jgi:threonine/homoserine/homoserine lactone efflux protein
MAVTIALLTLAYGTVVVMLTRHLAVNFGRDPRWGLWLNRAAGTALLGFGVKLALSR